jgi:hypothetical protein
MDLPPEGIRPAPPPQLSRLPPVDSQRLNYMRKLARIMDTVIMLPGGFRIGIDPIIGLIPGFGDAFATLFSLYLVYQGARLGIPKRVLIRMLGNVAIEGLVGTIPVAGDIFDAVYKANLRNLRLAERCWTPSMKERGGGRIIAGLILFALAFCTALLLLSYWIVKAIVERIGMF